MVRRRNRARSSKPEMVVVSRQGKPDPSGRLQRCHPTPSPLTYTGSAPHCSWSPLACPGERKGKDWPQVTKGHLGLGRVSAELAACVAQERGLAHSWPQPMFAFLGLSWAALELDFKACDLPGCGPLPYLSPVKGHKGKGPVRHHGVSGFLA